MQTSWESFRDAVLVLAGGAVALGGGRVLWRQLAVLHGGHGAH